MKWSLAIDEDPIPNLRKWAGGVADLIFPRDCVVTGEPVERGTWRYLSAAGLRQLRREMPFLYDSHGLPMGDGSVFGTTDAITPVFQQGRAALLARGAARRMVHVLKYHQGTHLLADMARLMVETAGLRCFFEDAVLVPVPLHSDRVRRRGYNQAELLARAVARQVLSARVAPVLARVRDTGTQTRLDREARQQNVRDAFALRTPVSLDLEARHIVLDDVFTTGATLNACCQALQDAGVGRLDVAAFAHG